jgi:hypothetical protein
LNPYIDFTDKYHLFISILGCFCGSGSRTKNTYHTVSSSLKTRTPQGVAGFLLSHAVASGSMAYQQKEGIFVGICSNMKSACQRRGRHSTRAGNQNDFHDTCADGPGRIMDGRVCRHGRWPAAGI